MAVCQASSTAFTPPSSLSAPIVIVGKTAAIAAANRHSSEMRRILIKGLLPVWSKIIKKRVARVCTPPSPTSAFILLPSALNSVILPAHAHHPLHVRREGLYGAAGRRINRVRHRRRADRPAPRHRRAVADRAAARAHRPDRHPLHRAQLPRARGRERVDDPEKPD